MPIPIEKSTFVNVCTRTLRYLPVNISTNRTASNCQCIRRDFNPLVHNVPKWSDTL